MKHQKKQEQIHFINNNRLFSELYTFPPGEVITTGNLDHPLSKQLLLCGTNFKIMRENTRVGWDMNLHLTVYQSRALPRYKKISFNFNSLKFQSSIVTFVEYENLITYQVLSKLDLLRLQNNQRHPPIGRYVSRYQTFQEIGKCTCSSYLAAKY